MMNDNIPENLFVLTVYLDAGLNEAQAGQVASLYEDQCLATTVLRHEDKHQGPWQIQWYMNGICDDARAKEYLKSIEEHSEHDVQKFTHEYIDPDTDWLEMSYAQFPPFSVEDFFIYGSHYDGDVPPRKIGLQIDAATAFGTGEHGTTKGCLLFMQALKKDDFKPSNVLDMGTGSGILAISAWKMWECPVLAIDIEDEAIRVSERHCEFNAVPQDAAGVTCRAGNGFAAPLVAAEKPYDLILANILAGPLKTMAADMNDCLAPSGYAILSGLLIEQAGDVIDAYAQQNLELVERKDIGEWTSLLFKKP